MKRAHLLQLVGLVAAVVLAFVVNVLASRHFTRWDWTQGKRWSLSPATLETLHSLEQHVDVWAIAGRGDPFEPSLRQLLASYVAQSSRVEVHWIDPDRDTVQLVDLQRRFGLEAGRTEDVDDGREHHGGHDAGHLQGLPAAVHPHLHASTARVAT